ncbi:MULTISPECIES: DUF421 domain-containing protein [unclassified Mesobacillus]|uniref:DUF421 domain-containing protein n=1 Tax=unclassified Mesobacillus TaxID=2675270 RepID=UPI00203A6F47|nr:DUF421 domain-containing protein [Mesobacillus sp. MER 33]MCM3234537.1 DUF421 domain-containing protein [Mesobacillus sp. MER 48]
MSIFLVKLIFLYIAFIAAVKILGKSALAQLTPHDFGAILFLSYLAFGSIKVNGVTEGIIGIIVITCVHLVISKLSLLNWLNPFIIGKPTILIKHGKIVFRNLRKSRYPLSELLSNLRTSGYPDIRDIEYVILEATGELSVLPKKELAPITPKDLHMKVEYYGLPIAVVIEGKVQKRNLKLINRNEEWLNKELKRKGYDRINNIFYASVREADHSLIVNTYEVNE